MFYEEVHGIIFVIDSTDVSRVRVVKELVEKMDKDLTSPMPVAFLVNKQDLEKSMTNEIVKSSIDIDHLESNIIWKFM